MHGIFFLHIFGDLADHPLLGLGQRKRKCRAVSFQQLFIDCVSDAFFLNDPKVRDLENLSEDILSVKGFWKNKVTRILLVVVFTNLGSTFGTFVALPLMYKAIG